MNYQWKKEELTLQEFQLFGVDSDKAAFKQAVKDYARMMDDSRTAHFDTSKENPTAILTYFWYGKRYPFVLQLRDDSKVWIAEPEWTEGDERKSGLFYQLLKQTFRGEHQSYSRWALRN